MIALPITIAVDGQPIVDQLLPYLKRIIMDINEVQAALEAANAKLEETNAKADAVKAQFEKGINEVILAMSQAQQVPQSIVDSVNRLNANVTAAAAGTDALAADATQLDGLNPDSTPAP